MRKLLDKAYFVIKPQIPSRQLRDALQRRNRGLEGDLFLPHYWAVIVHDGRGSFGPSSAKFLVYFQNPDDDPRKPTPQRAANQSSLTPTQFRAGVAENRRREAANPGGGPFQFMIIVVNDDGSPGRVGPASGTPFFSQGGRAFENAADDIVFRELDRFIRREVPREFKKARIRLS